MKKTFTILIAAIAAILMMAQPGKAMGQTFKRISSNILSDGDEIIFVNQAETYACGTTQNTNNRTPVAIETSNHKYTKANNDNVQVFTVKTNTISNTAVYGFHTGSGYIYSASSSNNNLKTNTTQASTAPTGTSAWTISVSSDVFSINNYTNYNGTGNNKKPYYLAFNGTSYFSQYYTGQSKPYVYERAFEVTYNAGGGSGTMSDSNSPYASGETVTLMDNTFTKDGFNFSGWVVKDASNNTISVTNNTFTMPRGVVTVTAQWTPATSDPYFEADNVEIAATATAGTISYIVNNSVVGGKVGAECTAGDAWISAVTVTDEDDDENTVSFTTSTNATGERVGTICLTYTYNSNETKTIDVTITQLTSTYTVTYYANHGSADPIVAGPYNYGTAVNAATNTFTAPSGKTFECWNTQADGNGTSYAAGEKITNSISSNKELYAKWRTLNTYSLVTSTDNIIPGKQYIIVSSNTISNTTTYYAMGKDRGTNRLAVPVTMNGDSKIVEADGVYEFFISGDANNFWTIYDINTLGLNASDSYGYLKALGGTSSNQLLTSTALNNQGQWTITISSNLAKIAANINGNNQRKYMKFNYNSNNPTLFSCYNSDEANVYLYVKDNNNTDGTIYSATTLSKNVSYNNLTIVKTVVNETPVINGSITVPNAKTLTVTGTLTNQGTAANLIIEDGGQLITANNASVNATVKKSVLAWNDTNKEGWNAISSPVNGQSFSDVANLQPTGDKTHNIYLYDPANVRWQEYRNNEAGVTPYTAFTNGRGYLYRKNNNTTIEFSGALNTGNVTYSSIYYDKDDVLKQYNLIGNPYAHNITKGSSSANILNGDILESKYCIFNSDGTWTLTNDGTAIAPGTAILVQAKKSGSITITNAAGSKGETANNDNIWFTVAGNEFKDVACVEFKNGHGFNKIAHRNEDAPMLYINHNGENFASVDMDDETKVINLCFKSNKMGLYTLTYNAKGVFSYLHLIDKITGEDVDMLIDDEYTFVGTSSDKEDRFIVKLAYLPDYGIDGSDTFAFQSGNEIFVSGEGELQIFDVTGRFVMSERINGAISISADALSKGVYVLRIVGSEIKTQKIVVR